MTYEIKKLGDVCKIIGGGTPSKSNKSFYNGNVLWATVRDMKADIIRETEHKITLDAVKKSSTNIIPKGNVVIATRVGLGKISYLEQDAAINQDLRGVIPNDLKELSVDYLFWWLKSISPEIVKAGTGATVQGVKLPFIKNLDIPLPSLPEQKRIVAILDEVFEGIAKAKQNAEKNLKNAREVFEASLTNILENPGTDWELSRLEEVSKITDGTHFSPKSTSEGKYMYITAKNIKPYYIDLRKITYLSEKDHREIYKRCPVKKGDVLYIKDGATTGIAALNPFEEEFSLLSSVALFKPTEKLLNTFLVHYMNSGIGRKNFLGFMGGAAITRLTLIKLKNVVIPLPPISKQKQIVYQLDTIREQTNKLEQIYQHKLELLEELKQSVLQKAFAGEL